jgi:hypothetical protein
VERKLVWGLVVFVIVGTALVAWRQPGTATVAPPAGGPTEIAPPRLKVHRLALLQRANERLNPILRSVPFAECIGRLPRDEREAMVLTNLQISISGDEPDLDHFLGCEYGPLVPFAIDTLENRVRTPAAFQIATVLRNVQPHLKPAGEAPREDVYGDWFRGLSDAETSVLRQRIRDGLRGAYEPFKRDLERYFDGD